ncbi:MAG: toprim domain-containing protein, partial [Methylobacterium sp.]|nr:toprim domain-containing protein [Methylobacterium sp.]
VAFGAYAGGLISVWKGRTGKSLRHLEAGEWVAMTEGVEDALTIAMVQPQMRAVAAISLSNLRNVTFPDRLGGLYLCADNDVKPEPQEAFRRAKAQIMSRGIAVREVRPPPQFKDFNDWARALRAEERRVMQGAAG